MNPRLLELMEQRGVLRARCSVQRQALAVDATPLVRVFGVLDQVRDGISWLRENPVVVGAAVAVLVIAKPRRAWRWGRKGLMVWQGWRSLRARLFSA